MTRQRNSRIAAALLDHAPVQSWTGKSSRTSTSSPRKRGPRTPGCEQRLNVLHLYLGPCLRREDRLGRRPRVSVVIPAKAGTQFISVIPAKAGTQFLNVVPAKAGTHAGHTLRHAWIPASAGMTALRRDAQVTTLRVGPRRGGDNGPSTGHLPSR